MKNKTPGYVRSVEVGTYVSDLVVTCGVNWPKWFSKSSFSLGYWLMLMMMLVLLLLFLTLFLSYFTISSLVDSSYIVSRVALRNGVRSLTSLSLRTLTHSLPRRLTNTTSLSLSFRFYSITSISEVNSNKVRTRETHTRPLLLSPLLHFYQFHLSDHKSATESRNGRTGEMNSRFQLAQ